MKVAMKNIKEKVQNLQNEGLVVGLRFENRQLDIGDTLDASRDNPDRDDERDFPAYDSAEYEALDELDGTSAWDLTYNHHWDTMESLLNDDAIKGMDFKHAYIVAGEDQGYGPDPAEILIGDCEVIMQIV